MFVFTCATSGNQLLKKMLKAQFIQQIFLFAMIEAGNKRLYVMSQIHSRLLIALHRMYKFKI